MLVFPWRRVERLADDFGGRAKAREGMLLGVFGGVGRLRADGWAALPCDSVPWMRVVCALRTVNALGTWRGASVVGRKWLLGGACSDVM